MEIQRLEIPDAEIINDHEDPFIASSIPLWKQTTDKTDQSDSPEMNPYPTPSPTVSREPTYELEDQNLNLVENVLENGDEDFQSEAYLKALIAAAENNSTKKDLVKNVPKIHRDSLPPPPTNFKQLDTHEFVNQFRQASIMELDNLLNKTFEIVSSYDGYRLPLKWV